MQQLALKQESPSDILESSEFDLTELSDIPEDVDLRYYKPTFKKLKPIHLQACSLIAQGFNITETAKLTGLSYNYLWILLQQPIIKEEVGRRSEVIAQRMELMTEKSCDVIAGAMQNGNHTEKLKAARLQLEVTKRVGAGNPMAVNVNIGDDRLNRLAERLETLITPHTGGIYDQDGNPL